jgi:hypothetical protein
VVVDESQLLISDCIELLRYLHDHRTTRFALILVGGNGTWRVCTSTRPSCRPSTPTGR